MVSIHFYCFLLELEESFSEMVAIIPNCTTSIEFQLVLLTIPEKSSEINLKQ